MSKLKLTLLGLSTALPLVLASAAQAQTYSFTSPTGSVPTTAGSSTNNAAPKFSGTAGDRLVNSSIVDAGAGVVIGSPTGGAQGAGTLNATGLYVNGVAAGGSGATKQAVNFQSLNVAAADTMFMGQAGANATYAYAGPFVAPGAGTLSGLVCTMGGGAGAGVTFYYDLFTSTIPGSGVTLPTAASQSGSQRVQMSGNTSPVSTTVNNTPVVMAAGDSAAVRIVAGTGSIPPNLTRCAMTWTPSY